MVAAIDPKPISLEEFLQQPCDRREWVDGKLVEKKEVTSKTGRIQARLTTYWNNHKDASGQGGEWLVFPDSQWVLVITQAQQMLFDQGSTATTQQVPTGFTTSIDQLLA